MNNFRAIWMPYVIAKVEDDNGGWIALNRHYKPLGLDSRVHVDYSAVPLTSRIKAIRESTVKTLSWNGRGIVQGESMIFLYSDCCVPTSSKRDWNLYCEKLSIIASLKTF
jgi:hypothetical protein